MQECKKVSPSGKNYKITMSHLLPLSLKKRIEDNKFFFDTCTQYFGFKPSLRYASLWLDTPVKNQDAKETQLWHRDPDDIFLLKVFIYLNDVNKENGPHSFVPESHRTPWNGSPRNSNFSASNGIDIIGKAGTIIIADTNGLHRGLKPEKNHRLLLTLNYTSSSPRSPFRENLWD